MATLWLMSCGSGGADDPSTQSAADTTPSATAPASPSDTPGSPAERSSSAASSAQDDASGSSDTTFESPAWRGIPDEVDSGFSLHEDAFRFENFGGDFAGRAMSAELAVEMFGAASVCVDGADPCEPTPTAAGWIRSVNETLEAGRSEGIAAAALLFHLGELDPVEFGAQSAADLRLHNNFGLQAIIARLSAAQRVPSIVESQRGMDAREALTFLSTALLDESEGWRLGMAIREDGGFRAGHALVPIGYYRVTGRASYILRVYDPNFPQAEGWVHFDLMANTWRYDGTATPELPVVYEGTPENGNLLYLAPVTPRLGPLAPPFATGSEALQVTAIGELSVVASLGDDVRGGFRDGELIEEGGVRVLPDFSACPCADGLRRNSTIHAPAGSGDADTEVEVSGNGSVFVGGPNYSARVDVPSGDGASGGGTLTVSADGRSATYESRDRVAEDEDEETIVTLVVPTDNGPLTVTVVVHPEADVSVSADAEGRVSVGVSGAPENSPVAVTVVEVAPDGSTRASTTRGRADESGEGNAAFEPGTGAYQGTLQPRPCENGVRDNDETDVDCGGSSCVARCEEGLRCLETSDCVDGLICGGAGRCVEPGCADGLQNLGETDVDCGGPCAPCGEGLGCESDADCESTLRCDAESDTCVWNTSIQAELLRGRLAEETVTIRVRVDGEQRTLVLAGTEEEASSRGDFGIGRSWQNAEVTAAPVGASCRFVGGTSGDWRNPVRVECLWSQALLRGRNVDLGEAWCAPSDAAAVQLQLRTDLETRDVPARGVLPMIPTSDFYGVDVISRPAPTWFPDREVWAMQSCDPSNQFGFRIAGSRFEEFDLTCQCLSCDEGEDECVSWARALGHLPTLAAGELCLDDSDCISRNCECGAESGYCITERGRCGGPKLISVAPWNENADQATTFTVPADCPGVYIQAWGAPGGGWYDLQLTGAPGGAGAFARGSVTVLEGDVLTVGVGTGGTTAGISELPGLGRGLSGFVRGGLGTLQSSDRMRGGHGGGATVVLLDDQPLPGFIVPGGAGGSVGATWVMPGGHPDAGGHTEKSGQDAEATPGFGGGGAGHPGGLGGTTAEPNARAGAWGPLPSGFEALHAEEETFYIAPGQESRDYADCTTALGGNLEPGRSPYSFFSQRGGLAGQGCVSLRCIHPERFDGALPEGARCTAHDDCRSEWCACAEDSGNCSGDSGFCSIPPNPEGAACQFHLECQTLWCGCGLSSGDCADESGTCVAPPEPGSTGTACTTDANCILGNCECGQFSGNCILGDGYCGAAMSVIHDPTEDGVQTSGSFTVPEDCPRVFISAWGAAGGASYDDFSFEMVAGGAGGHVEGYLDVEAGDVIDVWVGAGGHGGNDDAGVRSMGSRFGVPVLGGLGEVEAFSRGGGGGGGLTSVQQSGSGTTEFIVPAGGGTSAWNFETMAAAGLDGASDNDGPAGGDAEEDSGGGAGGGAGEPGGLGATMDFEEATGGAYGPLPAGFSALSADEFFAESPERTGSVNYVRCNEGDRDPAGAGNFFGPGGHGCVVIRCAAYTQEELDAAGGAP